ncbi:MAG: glycoside hydrolase family 99-like domain-containing protein, partial [Clostridia bacterium]|nr:glycoside hydrolase family 99-like domain-containing protein [Clostridia bacterium]
HVSLGWDNNPRHKVYNDYVMTGNTPERIEGTLKKAKEFAIKTGATLVTVNSWNEWTESSYLLPDDLNGYGYLNAVKKIFKEENK